MKTILRTLCLVAPVLLATSNAQADETAIVSSYGDANCSFMLIPSQRPAGEMYLMGFWSGANMWNKYNHNVGSGAHAAGIFAEVTRSCFGHPSKSLYEAATEVYSLQMRRALGLNR
jgi:hypothetical protein